MTKIPVLFHNSKGYDTHFLMQYISDHLVDGKKFDVIPKNNE
jgi:hypothetical protein